MAYRLEFIVPTDRHRSGIKLKLDICLGSITCNEENIEASQASPVAIRFVLVELVKDWVNSS